MANDAELFDAWSAGDQHAGAELFDRHFSAIARFFRNKVSDDFEDLVQQTFTACLEARERYRKASSFRTFLFGIANNVLREHLRRRSRNRLDPMESSAYDLEPGLSTAFAKAREQRLLVEALRRIPLEHQVILELFYWEELSAREVGEVLEQSEFTIRNRLRRGKELLRRSLSELAENPEELESTWDGLERWAEEVRGALE
ncbi:sigma-70 family RNA polymerase sigma factor [Pseudenhygromyxa sp. WMMC2535]|uniref:sigma-70 family RNA polymerase sigma factor n=1 Tax=Pseudenhygromyxa sp. WMMC2535 TaxID=2712867 RepID=UPI001552FDAF|nr:sigma-70 family RNA polymerase sigma factor [Pseudenhygromyxa sp. WMMC2535]